MTAVVTDDVSRARNALRPNLALYIGGMGARGRNFYNDLVCRYGYENEARQIQDLYLAGERVAAARAVPDELIDEVSLIGTADGIKDRLEVWQDAGVKTLNLTITDGQTLRTIPDLVG